MTFRPVWAVLFMVLGGWSQSYGSSVIVGSKGFTENVILGEIFTQWLNYSEIKAEHKVDLGGTAVLWAALLKGEIDLYPEYVGTIEKEILSQEGEISGLTQIKEALASKGIGVTNSLGFGNSYGIGMRRELALSLGIQKISDLKKYPSMRLVFSSGFLNRDDGWPGLKRHYDLSQNDVRGVFHSFSYQGLINEAFDATDVYMTDAEIAEYDILVLQDDKKFFPNYDAVILYRHDSIKKNKNLFERMQQLDGAVSEIKMRQLNHEVISNKKSEAVVAAEFLKEHFAVTVGVVSETPAKRMLRQTWQHMFLVVVSMFAAIAISIPLGILTAKRKRMGQVILSVTGVIQTIPSLALLVFMIPVFGIGTFPAIVALFLYSLLPILRSTHTGLASISPALLESAQVIGLKPSTILFSIELPLASREILSGIKTAAIINIGTATLGAIIGSGGLGESILTGIRLNDISLTLQGAIPAALLAVVAQFGFELMDKILIPKGLRLKSL